MLAYHSVEVPYLCGVIPGEQHVFAGVGEQYDGVDVAVADAMQHAWVTFARHGVPASTDGTPWPRCDNTAPRLAVIEDTARIEPLETTPVTQMIHSQRVDASPRQTA